MCSSFQPYGPQHTRLLCPWDSPGKNTGVYLKHCDPGHEIRGVARLAEQLNVSERQLIRVLKVFCDEGRLRHEKAGVYRVLPQKGSEKALDR